MNPHTPSSSTPSPSAHTTPPAAPRKVLLSWSSGKDSAWTLYQLQQNPAYEVIGLLTTFNQTFDRVAMHAVRRQLVRLQAEAAGLPLYEIELPYPCSNEEYEQRMGAFIEQAKALGTELFAFGDLYLRDIRAYREQRLAGTGLTPIFPLWDIPTDQLAADMLAAGLVAHLTCIDPRRVPASWAGRRFDQQLLAECPEGVDPCGENGEFHTFVSAGPMFHQPIAVTGGEVVEREGFVFADLLPASATASHSGTACTLATSE